MSTQARNTRDGQLGAEAAEHNVDVIARLERAARDDRSTADRLSDTISCVTGSMAFAVAHVAFFAAWILFNVGVLEGFDPFDPFPFGFLTLVVSLEAIFLSVFVLMSQNRMMRQSDKRAHLDLQVDLLAEQELTTMLQMLHALCAKLEVQVDIPEDRLRALSKDTDVHKLVSALDHELPR